MNPARRSPRSHEGTDEREFSGTWVVGLGASAGGVESLQRFFSHVPQDSGLAFVVVAHLEPKHPSLLVELLARHARMPVVDATDCTRPEPNRVYVIAPGTLLTLEHDSFQVKRPEPHSRTPVDAFFRSLAEDRGERAVGIILSGAGQDGTVGLKVIKEHGGLTLAQSPETARHDSMPQSAISAGLADHTLPVDRMPDTILQHVRYLTSRGLSARSIEADVEASLTRICALVHAHTGHDFSRYKAGTLVRRIRRRMQIRRIDSASQYLEVAESDAAEPKALLKDLLIGVTEFFRDQDAFRALAQQVVPRIVQGRGAEAPIRVWIPGCASGEEAYSVAILLVEHLERHGDRRFAQIFATDLDRGLLAGARRGRYGADIAERLSPDRLARFFVRDAHGNYQACKELREMCIFSEHNLIRDAPFSQLDLISCRNVLIYLDSELQKRLVQLFHYALRPGGFLFLGPAEGIAGSPELFETIDKHSRIFRRKETLTRPMVDFPLVARGWVRSAMTRNVQGPHEAKSPGSREQIAAGFERILREEYTFPAAVINERGDALFLAGPIGPYLQLPAGPAGALNLFECLRGVLCHELHVAVRAVKTRRRRVRRDNIPVEFDDRTSGVRLIVRPMPAVEADTELFLVVLQEGATTTEPDETAPREEAVPPLVAQLEDELRSTRAALRTTVEELESTNEELKSANEELVSTNEELQSANEEMQASTEELQSLNEELETVNTELRQKVDELGAANSDLQNLFAATEIATIFLDRSLRVVKFTPAATALFRLIDSDIGRPLADLAPRCAGQDLVSNAREVLDRLTPVEHQVQSADGAWFVVRVLPYRTVENVISGVLITFVEMSGVKRAEETARQQMQLVHLSHDAIFVRRFDGTIESWSRGAAELYGYTPEEAIGRRSHDLLATEFSQPLDDIEADLRKGGCWAGELCHQTKDHRSVIVLTNMVYARGADGVERILEANRDISERKRAEETEHRLLTEVRAEKDRLAALVNSMRDEVWLADAQKRFTIANPAALREFALGSGDIDVERFAASLEVFRADGSLRPVEEAPPLRALRGEVVVAQEEIVRSPSTGELRYRQVNATPVKDASGAIVGSVSVARDITDQKRAAAERERLATQRQLALDAARLGWWHYDPQTGRATYDDRYTEIFGVSGHERPNDEILKLLHPDDVPRVWAAVESALDPIDPKPYAVDYRINRPDGTTRWVEAHGAAVFEGEGAARRATSFVGTVADITDRKKAEARMGYIASFPERNPNPIVEADLDGTVLYANPAALALFPEPTKLEMAARWLFDWPATVERLRVTARDVRTVVVGDRTYHQTLVLSADGVRTYGLDITEASRAQEALRASEERFRTLATNTQDSIARFDRLGRYVYANPVVMRLLKRPIEAIVGRTPTELGRGEGLEAFNRALSGVFESGEPSRLDRRTIEGRWLDLQLIPEFRGGEVDTVLVVSRDITDRKQAEDALRESEERYRGIVETASEGIWTTDPDGRLLFVNERTAEMLGYAPGELIGRFAFDFMDPQAAALARANLERRRQGYRDRYELRFVRKDGSALWAIVGATPITDREGTFVASMGVLLDITERKLAEEALRQANLALAEADQRKNEFLAMLSHELRNPLAPIRYSIRILERVAPGSEAARRAQEVIDRQAVQLTRLVDDLLDVTRITRGKIQLQREQFDLNELIRRTVIDHASVFEERGIAVQTDLVNAGLPVDGDQARLAQAVGNLLQNAAKFTPAGGSVIVTTSVSNARARLRVVDSGRGMDQALLRRLFQPFMQADTTLDRSKGGLGLGLALVKGLVEMHGGAVCAHSDGPGCGAEFVVELPLDSRRITRPDVPPAPAAESRRVLIIEDNVDAADSLRDLLAYYGHVVAVAYNGLEGFAKAREFGPEVVLCDIGLPGMDGFEIARAFKSDEWLRRITLIALTGYALPEDLQRAADAGFARHIAKPPSPEELQRVLRDL
jgi:two-component system, chemotaxis family, CheB/CheR fusion protein